MKFIKVNRYWLVSIIQNLMEASYIWGYTKGFVKGFWKYISPDTQDNLDQQEQIKLNMLKRFLDKIKDDMGRNEKE